ncbi:MAG: AAA family ATPase [Actinobacteria bacterium]|nr:AAA family ATPase [Actinomycetota bacterium]
MAGLKLAVTGKGGVGKTTIAGTLARIMAARGLRVIAVDADPDANLAGAVGATPAAAAAITPISAMKDLIRERTGAEPGSLAPVFKMNPRVDDIPAAMSVEAQGVRLLKLGTVMTGGGGCICPESALLKSLLSHLMLAEKDVVIVDMEAGIEHLGRATARGVDAMLIVAEPGKRSLQTADDITRLAGEIGISRLFLIINKVTDDDAGFCRDLEQNYDVLGCLPFDSSVRTADLDEESPYDAAPAYAAEVGKILGKLEDRLGRG